MCLLLGQTWPWHVHTHPSTAADCPQAPHVMMRPVKFALAYSFLARKGGAQCNHKNLCWGWLTDPRPIQTLHTMVDRKQNQTQISQMHAEGDRTVETGGNQYSKRLRKHVLSHDHIPERISKGVIFAVKNKGGRLGCD